MAFGFPPLVVRKIPLQQYTAAQFLVIAERTMQELGWEVEQIGPLELIAFTPESPESASERVNVRIKDGIVTLKSQCLERQLIDWGKNRLNLHHLLIEFKETAFAMEAVEMEKKAVARISEWDARREEEEPKMNSLPRRAGNWVVFLPC